jgi:hypothetical protein
MSHTPSPRLPPDALPAERALAGCIIIDHANTVADTLRNLNFDRATMLGSLWADVVGHALNNPGPHDPISVAAALPHHPDALARLSDVMHDCVWSPGSVATYATVITEAHRYRATLEIIAHIGDACYDRQDPTAHLAPLADLWQPQTGSVP